MKLSERGIVYTNYLGERAEHSFPSGVNDHGILTKFGNQIYTQLFTLATSLAKTISKQPSKTITQTAVARQNVYKTAQRPLVERIRVLPSIVKSISRFLSITIHVIGTLLKTKYILLEQKIVARININKTAWKLLTDTIHVIEHVTKHISRPATVQDIKLSVIEIHSKVFVAIQNIVIRNSIVRNISKVITLRPVISLINKKNITKYITTIITILTNITHSPIKKLTQHIILIPVFNKIVSKIMSFIEPIKIIPQSIRGRYILLTKGITISLIFSKLRQFRHTAAKTLIRINKKATEILLGD